MLETLKNAFRVKEIRKKILFTLVMLVVIRIGSQLPVPGVGCHHKRQPVCPCDPPGRGQPVRAYASQLPL